MRTILFYGSFGKHATPDKMGGVEIGCQKTENILYKNDFNIIRIDKPVNYRGKFWYFIDLLRVYFLLVSLLLKYKDSYLHVCGFYELLLPIESLLLMTARLFGHKTIYELRNGGMIESYINGSIFYRRTLKNAILKSDMVLCQGKEYVDFIKDKWNYNTVWYPNYIMSTFINEIPFHKLDNSMLRLVYLGRVTPSKNIDVILQIANILACQYGYKYHLDIIGGYEDSYKCQLDKIIQSLGITKSQITFHGRMEIEQFYPIMLQDDIYIFPSTEKREGHSNALTEAMGCGLVPVASNVGFNRTIVDNDELIVDGIDPNKYAEVIDNIVKKGNYEELSNAAYQRIIHNFSEDIVGHNLIHAYKSLAQ